MNHYVRITGSINNVTAFIMRLREGRIPMVVSTIKNQLTAWDKSDDPADRQWWCSRLVLDSFTKLSGSGGEPCDISFWVRDRDYTLVATMAPSALERL